MAYPNRGIDLIGSLIARNFRGGGRRRGSLPNAGQIAPLSPALRAVLQRRASRGAARIYAPQISQLEAQKEAIRRSYHRQIQGAQATGEGIQGSIGDIEAEARDSGLHGQFLQQTLQGLEQEKGNAAAYGPYIKSTLQPQRRADLLSVNQDVAKAEVAQQQDAARKLYSLISQARTRGISAANAQGGGAGGGGAAGGPGGSDQEWRTALASIQRIIAENGDPNVVPRDEAKKGATPESQWAAVERLAAGEGVDPLTARRAVQYYRGFAGATASAQQAPNADPLTAAIQRLLQITGGRQLTTGY